MNKNRAVVLLLLLLLLWLQRDPRGRGRARPQPLPTHNSGELPNHLMEGSVNNYTTALIVRAGGADAQTARLLFCLQHPLPALPWNHPTAVLRASYAPAVVRGGDLEGVGF